MFEKLFHHKLKKVKFKLIAFVTLLYHGHKRNSI
jgi:uncharacterized membrane protein YsdA (DUF1294 family)